MSLTNEVCGLGQLHSNDLPVSCQPHDLLISTCSNKNGCVHPTTGPPNVNPLTHDCRFVNHPHGRRIEQRTSIITRFYTITPSHYNCGVPPPPKHWTNSRGIFLVMAYI